MIAYNLSNLSFLVVDDNPHMQHIIETLFTGLGVKNVRIVATGEDALKELAALPADIVICDWMMSPMSGIELVRELRDETKSPNALVPIIMLSGHSEAHRVKEARDCGVNAFLTKPVSAKALYNHIASVIHHALPFVRTETYFGPDRRRQADPNYTGPERRGVQQEAVENSAAARA